MGMMILSRNFKDLKACAQYVEIVSIPKLPVSQGDSTCYLSGNSLSYSGLVALPDVPKDVFNQPFTETDNLWLRTTTYHLSKEQILLNPSNSWSILFSQGHVFFIFVERQSGLVKIANKKN
ncbi:hypothetical protein AAG906_021644 [Vitis piasezkii]